MAQRGAIAGIPATKQRPLTKAALKRRAKALGKLLEVAEAFDANVPAGERSWLSERKWHFLEDTRERLEQWGGGYPDVGSPVQVAAPYRPPAPGRWRPSPRRRLRARPQAASAAEGAARNRRQHR